MKSRKTLFLGINAIAIVSLLLMTGVVNAAGQNFVPTPPITHPSQAVVSVKTDRSSYEPGDIVFINGTISNEISGDSLVQLTVVDPGSNLLVRTSVNTNNGAYYYSLTLSQSVILGIYHVSSTYHDSSASTSFIVESPKGSTATIPATISTVSPPVLVSYFPVNATGIVGDSQAFTVEISPAQPEPVMVTISSISPLGASFPPRVIIPQNMNKVIFSVIPTFSGLMISNAILGTSQLSSTFEIVNSPHSNSQSYYPPSANPNPQALPASAVLIPNWIKKPAKWWSEGQIGDLDFLQGIQWLIKNGIIHLPPTTQGEASSGLEIPSWIKNNAALWAKGQVDDRTFAGGLQYLISNGIIVIPPSIKVHP